ncbi:hypothetical protein PIB30_071988, partial [Stylosanthes scabra]|nr:hypothetical protein [Stylosanthes scabra]
MRDDNAMFDLGGSKIELMACEETKKKLEKSVVGETLNPFIFNELKEAVKRDWDSIVEIKKMGDTKILLTFDTEENLSVALHSPMLLNNFLEVRRWTCGESNLSRRFWIEIVGVPAHAWGLESARKIVSGPTVPPGFENSTKRIVTFDEDIRDSTDQGATCRGRVNRKEKNLVSLRLKDRVLRNKKSSLNKKEKQRELVETCEILGDLSSSEEDFSNTDVEASKTWTLGTGLGLATVQESRLNKFLKDTGTTGDAMKLYTNNNVPQKRRGRKKKKKAEVLG